MKIQCQCASIDTVVLGIDPTDKSSVPFWRQSYNYVQLGDCSTISEILFIDK